MTLRVSLACLLSFIFCFAQLAPPTALTSTVDAAVATIGFLLNGATVANQPAENFINTPSVTWNVRNDVANGKADITAVVSGGGGGGIGFPPVGIPNSTGTAWGNSYSLSSLISALPACSPSTVGTVPATGGGTTNFLRADCTWSAPPSGGGGGGMVYPPAGVPNSTGTGWAASYNATSLTAFLNLFTTTLQGLVPAPGSSSSTLFLAANGSWLTPSGSAGALTVQVGGTSTASSATTLNFNAGAGTIPSCTYNAGASRNDCSIAYNSAVIPTHNTVHANEVFCNSTNGTVNYTCSLATSGQVLTQYNLGLELLLYVDTLSTNSATINVDGLGNITLKNTDCTSAIGANIATGQFYRVAYNSTGPVFCLVH